MLQRIAGWPDSLWEALVFFYGLVKARWRAARWCGLGGRLASRPVGAGHPPLTHADRDPFVGLALDFSKCYDRLRLAVLREVALRASDASALAAPLLACYTHERRVRADGLVGAA